MKRILFILLMAVSLVAVQSCEEKPKFGFAYSFTAVGDAKGDVDVVFPGGEFKGLGDAAIDFHFTNATPNETYSPDNRR